MNAADLEKLQQSLGDALSATGRTAAVLAEQDVTFLRIADPSVAVTLDKVRAKVIRMVSQVLQLLHEDSPCKITSIEGDWREIVEGLDQLMEKTVRRLAISLGSNIKGCEY